MPQPSYVVERQCIQGFVDHSCAKMTGEQENKRHCLQSLTLFRLSEIRQERASPVSLLLWFGIQFPNLLEYHGCD